MTEDALDDKLVTDFLAHAPKRMTTIMDLFSHHRAKRAYQACERLGAKEDGSTGFWALPPAEVQP